MRDNADFEFAKGGPVSAMHWGEPKLNQKETVVDGLAFLGLSLSRNHRDSGVGHDASVTRQTQFDFNRIQDRSYKWFQMTDHHGWLLGGGEPSDSCKMPNPDSAHCEIVRVGTFQKELGGLPKEDILKAVADRKLLIPEFRIMPTAVVGNPDQPPEVEVRFDLVADPEKNVEEWANWQLPFVMNQIYDLFKFPGRFTPGAFHATMVRKAGFRDAVALKAYFKHCSDVVAEWRAHGPVLLTGEDKDASGAPGGLHFFRDANTVVGYVEPNFLPPYNTPEKRKLIEDVINKKWDEKGLCWKVRTMDDPAEEVSLTGNQRFAAWLICAFSFCLANVNDGLGPIQSVYLVVAKEWNPGAAGVIWMVREFTSMAFAPFVGGILDNSEQKRVVVASFIFALSIVNVAIYFRDDFWLLFLFARAFLAGFFGTAIRPSVATLLLGIVGPDSYDAWVGTSEVFNHLGCILALALAGAVSYVLFPDVGSLFAVFGAFGLIGVLCILFIPVGAIDFHRARNQTQELGDEAGRTKSGRFQVGSLFRDRNLMLFAFLVFIFHFTNAPMLPLLGQVMGSGGGRDGMAWATSAIVFANIISTPAALVMKPVTEKLGWKWVHYVGWGNNIPRAALIVVVMRYFASNKYGLLASQVFDGISAAVNGVAAMEVTRMLTAGTGRFGVANGFVNMCWGAGVATGNVVFGYVADSSYELAFIICGAAVVVPLLGLIPLQFQANPASQTSRLAEVELGTMDS